MMGFPLLRGHCDLEYRVFDQGAGASAWWTVEAEMPTDGANVLASFSCLRLCGVLSHARWTRWERDPCEEVVAACVLIQRTSSQHFLWSHQ